MPSDLVERVAREAARIRHRHVRQYGKRCRVMAVDLMTAETAITIVRDEAVKALRQAVDDGYPPVNQSATGHCEHGTYGHEDCIPCYDAHLLKALERLGEDG